MISSTASLIYTKKKGLERSNRNMPGAYCCNQFKNWLLSMSKNLSLRTSPQAGVAIPEVFRMVFDAFTAKTGGFPRQCAHWLY